eukprot:SAG11_NODE_933_length_6488_cov_18.190014_2_plen_172_part_00
MCDFPPIFANATCPWFAFVLEHATSKKMSPDVLHGSVLQLINADATAAVSHWMVVSESNVTTTEAIRTVQKMPMLMALQYGTNATSLVFFSSLAGYSSLIVDGKTWLHAQHNDIRPCKPLLCAAMLQCCNKMQKTPLLLYTHIRVFWYGSKVGAGLALAVYTLFDLQQQLR